MQQSELRQYESDCVVKVMRDVIASSTKTMDDGTDDVKNDIVELKEDIKSMEDKLNEILKYISREKKP